VSQPADRPAESGYSMVALLAAVAVMLVLMTAAVPYWRYVVQNDREEELLFRGGEIADAIARYQKKNGNALPVSLDVLVKGKFLRRAYKDPMTKGGQWRLLRPGQAIGPLPPGVPQPGGTGAATTTTTTRPSAFSQPGFTLGVIQGVASTSTEKSLRVFNGRNHYNEWLFLPGQPRVIGRAVTTRPGVPGVPGRAATPGPVAPGIRPRQP
jgi:type II secretory pathway pseudopilin PulG